MLLLESADNAHQNRIGRVELIAIDKFNETHERTLRSD